jgi:hypothetical protein
MPMTRNMKIAAVAATMVASALVPELLFVTAPFFVSAAGSYSLDYAIQRILGYRAYEIIAVRETTFCWGSLFLAFNSFVVWKKDIVINKLVAITVAKWNALSLGLGVLAHAGLIVSGRVLFTNNTLQVREKIAVIGAVLASQQTGQLCSKHLADDIADRLGGIVPYLSVVMASLIGTGAGYLAADYAVALVEKMFTNAVPTSPVVAPTAPMRIAVTPQVPTPQHQQRLLQHEGEQPQRPSL